MDNNKNEKKKNTVKHAKKSKKRSLFDLFESTEKREKVKKQDVLTETFGNQSAEASNHRSEQGVAHSIDKKVDVKIDATKLPETAEDSLRTELTLDDPILIELQNGGRMDQNSNPEAYDKKDQKSPMTFNPEEGVFKKQPIVWTPPKSVVSAKLTIILLENTKATFEKKAIIGGFIKRQILSDFFCFVSYDEVVKVSKLFDTLDAFDISSYLTGQGEKACLYDAISELQNIVLESKSKNYERKGQLAKINQIIIYGFGTSVDNCSKTSLREALEAISKIRGNEKYTTKYLCLTDSEFVNAAAIGFRSIGALSKSYENKENK